jgi:hypothetical protein
MSNVRSVLPRPTAQPSKPTEKEECDIFVIESTVFKLMAPRAREYY